MILCFIMDLIAIAFALTIPLAPVSEPIVFDVTPFVAIEVPQITSRPYATSLGPLLLYNEFSQGESMYDYVGISGYNMVHHELKHWRQQASLGPIFWIVYAMTMGEVFEPYSPIDLFAPLDFGKVYHPPPEDFGNFPFFRFSFNTDSTITLSAFPGYPQLFVK